MKTSFKSSLTGAALMMFAHGADAQQCCVSQPLPEAYGHVLDNYEGLIDACNELAEETKTPEREMQYFQGNVRYAKLPKEICAMIEKSGKKPNLVWSNHKYQVNHDIVNSGAYGSAATSGSGNANGVQRPDATYGEPKPLENNPK